jgi:hypothetical protein
MDYCVQSLTCLHHFVSCVCHSKYMLVASMHLFPLNCIASLQACVYWVASDRDINPSILFCSLTFLL